MCYPYYVFSDEPELEELIGKTKIQKKTKSMVFLTCELKALDKIVATASGVWKILKLTGAGPGG